MKSAISFPSFPSVLLCFLSVLASVGSLLADDGSWKPGSGTGVWSASNNWVGDPASVPGGAGSTVTLSPSTGSPVTFTIDGAVSSRTVGTLIFGGGSGTRYIVGTDGGALTFNNGVSDAALNVVTGGSSGIDIWNPLPVILASSLVIDVEVPRTLFIHSVISETGGAKSVTKTGVGTLKFSATNTFTGTMIVNGGTLSAYGNNNVFINSGGMQINNGATFDTLGATQNLGGGLTVNNGTVGAVTSTVEELKSSSYTVNQGAIYTRLSSNNATLDKVGGGTFELAGVYKGYTGATTINGGTLVISGGASTPPVRLPSPAAHSDTTAPPA